MKNDIITNAIDKNGRGSPVKQTTAYKKMMQDDSESQPPTVNGGATSFNKSGMEGGMKENAVYKMA